MRAVLVALTAASSLATPAAAQTPKPWTHGVIEPKGDAGFSLMVSRRGFARKARAQDQDRLAAERHARPQGAARRANSTASSSSPGAAILAGLRGADLKIVGCDWPGVLHGMMAKAPITEISELKGKTIAISAPGSLPDLVARALFAKYNMTPADVKVASLGSDLDRFKSLIAGVAQGAIVTEELMAVAPKDIRLIATGRSALPNYVRLCLTVTGKTLTQRRDDVVNFLAAEIEALRFATTHRDETIALTREIIETKPDDPRAAYVYDIVVKNHDVDPEITIPMDKLDWMQNELVRPATCRSRAISPRSSIRPRGPGRWNWQDINDGPALA